MLRRNKPRTIAFVPDCTWFRAEGSEGSDTEAEDVIIGLDMLEAMRLVDAENLSQQEAAARMNVSTPTLCRILAEARRRTIEALLGGCNIRLDGGNIMLTEELTKEGHGFRHGQENGQGNGHGQGRHGQGRGRGFGAGHGRGGHGQGAGQGHGQSMADIDEGHAHCGQGSAEGEECQGGSAAHGHGQHGQHGPRGQAAATVHYHYHYHCTMQPDQLPRPCFPEKAAGLSGDDPVCEG